MRFTLTVALFLFAQVMFSGCVSTTTPVSSALPYEVQQDIRTAEGTDVSFEFIPHAGSDEMEADFSGAKARYRLNGPMRGLFQELVESKFATIEESASDQIRIELTDVQDEVSGQTYRLSVTAEVTTVHDGETNSRNISYSQTMQAQDQGTDYTVSYGLPSDEIENFMIKFAVAADRFIDANFGIR